MHQKEVKSEENREFFDPKQINLAYTVGIIKPDTAMKTKNVQTIIDRIEATGLIIQNMIQRELIKEEAINIFYKHFGKPHYQSLIEYILSGQCVVLLLCHQNENPIDLWKKLIGNKDPVQAKKSDPNSLRALFGQTLVKNELHGSDNPIQANKQRDIFKFPIPQKIPDFHFNKMKVSIETLLQFIYPPNLEHPNVNGRLDIFGQYGPVCQYHSVDQCLCIPCSRIGKDVLEIVKRDQIIEEKKQMGLELKNDAILKQFENSMSTTKRNGAGTDNKYKIPPIRLLKEEDMQKIYHHLCQKCQEHVDNSSHMCCGRDAQHIMTDHEIDELAKEMNKKDLLDLLLIEKGNAAQIMIEQIPLQEPDDLVYNKELIHILFSDLQTDYYQRYDFSDMQQVILEDRRIRMNAWMSQIIGKPLERFKNPKLIDPTIPQSTRRDPKSVHFTLTRQLPLSMTYQQEKITSVPVEFPESLCDKPKLLPNQEKLALSQKLTRYVTQIVEIDDINKGDSYQISVNMLRNYNAGRHGDWNNYATLQGINKGTYVKSQNHPNNSEFG